MCVRPEKRFQHCMYSVKSPSSEGISRIVSSTTSDQYPSASHVLFRKKAELMTRAHRMGPRRTHHDPLAESVAVQERCQSNPSMQRRISNTVRGTLDSPIRLTNDRPTNPDCSPDERILSYLLEQIRGTPSKTMTTEGTCAT